MGVVKAIKAKALGNKYTHSCQNGKGNRKGHERPRRCSESEVLHSGIFMTMSPHKTYGTIPTKYLGKSPSGNLPPFYSCILVY